MNSYKGMSIKELSRLPEFSQARPYFIGGQGPDVRTYMDLQGENLRLAGWNEDNIAYGLTRLAEISNTYSQYVYRIYPEEEIKLQRNKRDAAVIYFPAKKASKLKEGSPYIIVIAGGGFKNVCTVLESFPVAAKLNDLGYTAFVFNYRVGGVGVLPRPIDDLAQAIRFINAHEKHFQITGNNYVVCGFSAGGTITALWGTVNHGYKNYQLPKPKALIPVYAGINSNYYGNSIMFNDVDPQISKKKKSYFFRKAFGTTNPNKIAEYNVDEHIDNEYPPCYLCCCKDDPLVSWRNSLILQNKLNDLNIPVEFELGESGGHGYGLGNHVSVKGWVERAMKFIEQL